MPDTAVVSGSDLTSTQGNAALGYSGGGGVAYNANPAIVNPFEATQNTITRLQEHDAQMNALKYQQALQEREGLAKMLADTGNSVFNMGGGGQGAGSFSPLPQDAEVLSTTAADARREIMSNPQNARFNPKVAQLTDKLKRENLHAQTRAVEYAKAKAAAAATNDPEERAAILRHAKEQVEDKGLLDFHNPEPFMPKQTFSLTDLGITDKLLTDKDSYSTLNSTIQSRDGVDYQVDQKGLAMSVLDPTSKIMSDSKAATTARNITNAFFQNPQTNNPQHIMEMNQAIDANNKARGLTGTAAAPHIAEVMPDGTVKYTNTDPISVNRAILMAGYGKIVHDEKPSDAGIKQRGEKIDQKYKGVLTDVQAKTLSQMDERLRLDKEKAEQDKNKMSKVEREEKLDEITGKSAASVVINNMADISKKYTFKQPDFIQKEVLSTVLPDIDNYEIATINTVGQTERNISGIQSTDPYKGTPVKGVGAPVEVIFAKAKNGNINDNRYIVKYYDYEPKLDESGNVKVDGSGKLKMNRELKFKAITPQEAIGNHIVAKENFAGNPEKNTRRSDLGVEEYNKIIGGGSKPTPQEPSAQPAKRVTIPMASIPEANKKLENGRRMVLHDGEWRHVIGRDANGNLVLE